MKSSGIDSGGLPGLKLSGHLITPWSPSQTLEENTQKVIFKAGYFSAISIFILRNVEKVKQAIRFSGGTKYHVPIV